MRGEIRTPNANGETDMTWPEAAVEIAKQVSVPWCFFWIAMGGGFQIVKTVVNNKIKDEDDGE